jgi:hypothetical protein
VNDALRLLVTVAQTKIRDRKKKRHSA